MTKFHKFLKKYDVHLTTENSGPHYQMFIKWKNGGIKSPRADSIDKFYQLFKGKINFDKKGLEDCFKVVGESIYYESPFILGVEGGVNRKYFYLFTNYLLKNIKNERKVLVIDEEKYRYVYKMLGKPHSNDTEILELTKLEGYKEKILPTNHENIDYISFFIHEKIDPGFEKIKELSLQLYKKIKELNDYDLVIINYRQHPQTERICQMIRQVCDQVYYIGSENKYEISYEELKQYSHDLEILKSSLSYKVAYANRIDKATILNEERSINYFKYLQMTKEILGVDENTESYYSILKPKVHNDLKRLYHTFQRTCFFKGFQEKDYFLDK